MVHMQSRLIVLKEMWESVRIYNVFEKSAHRGCIYLFKNTMILL